MSNGASRLFNVIKNTSESTNITPSQLISLTVKSIEPLIFIRDDRLEITADFCVFNRSINMDSFQIGDIVTAFVFNNGQSYFIQQNDTAVAEVVDYNDLANKPKINGVELLGNKTLSNLGIAPSSAVADSGWITVTNLSNFVPYGDRSNPFQYRRIGKSVQIRGILTPINTLSADAETTVTTLPNAYKPDKSIYQLCVGEDKNTWLLTIRSTGVITVSRYGTTSSTQITNGTWLSFDKMFFVN